jgi:F0F1-type ATP synthase membrane subunit c/vacuolar-type H+-ATPase subunit K
MGKLLQQKRILICTFVALVSGVSSAYIGGQISLKTHSHSCQAQPWGLKAGCTAWVAPRAIWQGSTTGLWVGLVLGAFISGLATRPSANKETTTREGLTEAVSLCADEIELTDAQREALRRFLILLVVKLGSTRAEKLSLDELQSLADVAEQTLIKQDLSVEEARQLLLKFGFSDQISSDNLFSK